MTDNQQNHITLALNALQAGQAKIAEQQFKQALQIGPLPIEIRHKYGVALLMQGRRREAIEFYEDVLENEYYSPSINNLALAYAEEENFEKSWNLLLQGIERDPDYMPFYSVLALSCKPLNKAKDAVVFLQEAKIRNNDCNLQLLTNLGSLLAEIGDKDEANALFEDILRREPANIKAHSMLALGKKYSSTKDAHILQMIEIGLDEGLAIRDKAEIYFALGKAFEDCQDYEKSYHYLKQANALWRSLYQYSISEDAERFEKIQADFDNNFVAENQVDPRDEIPVFIIGMPRSGTSLVEQILASHSDVYGAGELPYLHSLYKSYSSSVVIDNAEDFKNMATSYLSKTQDALAGCKFFTDKMPLNFRYIGLILTLFPHAKIIHCKRDKRDVILSIFKKNFAGTMEFAYDLEEIHQFFILYENMMDYWHSEFPDQIYDCEYANLITQPEQQIKSLLHFCGLKWVQSCMDFHKNDRFVSTASTHQVRQPIYKTGLEYWKNYAPFLKVDLPDLYS